MFLVHRGAHMGKKEPRGCLVLDARKLRAIRELRYAFYKSRAKADKFRIAKELLKEFSLNAKSISEAMTFVETCITASQKVIDVAQKGLRPGMPVNAYARFGFIDYISNRGTVIVRFDDGELPRKQGFNPASVESVKN